MPTPTTFPDGFYKEVNPNQITDVRKEYGFMDEKSLNEAIDILEEWIKKQNHFTVTEFDRSYLERNIINNKGSVERAKIRFDKRVTLTKLLPEIFADIQVETEFKELYKTCMSMHMPLSTKDYHRISIDKFMPNGLDNFDMITLGRYVRLKAEYAMKNDYCMGFIIIVDYLDLKMVDFLTKFNPASVHKVQVMLTEGYGDRVKGIHLLVSSKLVDAVVTLIKAGLKEKIKNRIHIHNTPNTLKDFIEEDCLPFEYGGTAGSMKEIHDKFFNHINSEENKRWLEKVSNFGTDESKRISSKFNEDYLGMPGTFRSLSVD